MTMITPSYLGETIEYSSLHACRSTLEDPTLKLKGIDGDPHKRWSMWFNSMQREEPYLVLTYTELSRDGLVPSGTVIQVLHGCRQLVS